MRWPLDVTVHLIGTGRTPAASCPRIEQRAAGDVAEILPYLDGVRVNSMLDIGCGLALVDVLLARAVAPRRVYLLDSEGTGTLDRGYKVEMKAWNSTAIAASMFHANVDVGVELVLLEPGPFEVDEPVDLIVSTRSWGHHYPVSMYLESVSRSMVAGGVLAVDLRAGRGGAAEIQAAGFDQVAVIAQPSGKCDRVIFRRR
jgi:SAM-dependent methyltransferase